MVKALLLVVEGLRGKFVYSLKALLQEYVPRHESWLTIFEEREQFLDLRLEFIEVDSLLRRLHVVFPFCCGVHK